MITLLLWTSLFAVGVLVLVKAADLLVSGGASLALRFGVPALIIGMTLISFGTTLPEMASSINATLKGHTEMAVGNILGSIIANTLLVLGVSAMIRPMSVKQSILKKEIPFMLGAMLLLIMISINGMIQRWHGVVLLFLLVVYLFYMIRAAKNSDERSMVLEAGIVKNGDTKIDTVKVIIGVLGIILGAEFMITGAVFYMGYFGLSEGVIGLSIIALATSLPELATSSVASVKGEFDISVGNVMGANILNILLVIGVCSLMLPLHVSSKMMVDMAIMLGVGLFLAFIVSTGSKISRAEGAVMVVVYGVFMVYLYLP